MKALIVIIIIGCTVFCLSFVRRDENTYSKLYSDDLKEFSRQEALLQGVIDGADLSSAAGIQKVKQNIEGARLRLKKIDFWLRYLEPIAYNRINGPLPVEWENEVFEKYEPPYRRTGAGLSLAEMYLDENPLVKDTLLSLIRQSREAIKIFEADSITSQLNSCNQFFLANRLFLLNLAAIYTTGFECPDTSRIIPELKSMLMDTKTIYENFNQSFPQTRLGKDYLDKYDETVSFVKGQPVNFSAFDNFTFIRDYVNPLFALNQRFINAYQVTSINFNDYTLNDSVSTIFSKFLYSSQNTKGIYSLVDDEKTLSEIRHVGKLLFYDPILSGNNLRSCASCHKSAEYFNDTTQQTSFQFDHQHHLPRNTPTLINAIYNHLLMLDGKHITLQAQGREVLTKPDEMNANPEELIKKLLTCKEYKEAFRKLTKLTPEEGNLSLDHIVSAITFYYGSFSRFSAPFDDAMNGKRPAPDIVKKGFNLFMTKAQCGTCHFVPYFNGVKPPYISSEFEVLGTPEDSAFKSLSADEGRYLVNPAPETMHAFRTGTIRNAAFTKPYMHNGVFNSLDEVIDFYNDGGGSGRKLAVANQTLSGDSLKLSNEEKKELIAFIYSLNEKIKFEDPPLTLPVSSNKALNKRQVGGQY